jgi:hypothetical protein
MRGPTPRMHLKFHKILEPRDADSTAGPKDHDAALNYPIRPLTLYLIAIIRYYMNRRAQAATQYILTYGFGIVVVLAMAYGIWHLGVLQPRVGYSFTSTDFQGVKPLIATCTGGSNNWNTAADVRGLTCTFVNGVGTDIYIMDAHITVTKPSQASEPCYINVAASGNGPTGAATLNNNWIVSNIGGVLACYQVGTATPCQVVPGGFGWRLEPKREFVVMGLGQNAAGNRNCYYLLPDDRFQASIDILYTTDVGKILSVGHAFGIIRNT